MVLHLQPTSFAATSLALSPDHHLVFLLYGPIGGSVVKYPPAKMQETRETWVLSPGWEDEEMATHSSILAWKIPWIGP